MKRLILGFAGVLALAVPPPALAQTAAQDLVAARAHYGPLLTRAQAAAVLNEVAWKHKDEGFGLLRKPGGNRCPQPTTNIDVSCDWLVNRKTGRGGDVLGSATNDDGSPAPATAGFNQDSAYDGSNFVEPVAPEGGGTVPDPPPPPPNLDVARALVALSVRLDQLGTQLDNLARLVANQPDLRAQLDANQQALGSIWQALEHLPFIAPITFPVYKGRVLGQPFTLTPQK